MEKLRGATGGRGRGMYEKRYGLNRRPFSLSSASPTYYPATAHEHASRLALDALGGGCGFAVLSGDAGMGKTLLAQRLVEKLETERQALWLITPFVADATGLYQAILYDLASPYAGKTEQELRLDVIDHLLKAFESGRPMLWVLDEAQHVRLRVLEELRILTALEARPGRALQVLLVGQPGLTRMLRQPELRAVAQRVGAWLELTPLDVHESVDYLVHHLRAANGRPERIVTAEALEILARGAAGVPRVLSQCADRAFQLAAAAESDMLDAEAALEALAEVGLSDEDAPAAPPPRREAA
jgi:type II secretory pathway predicted ATPase ExeA